jgi:hypothetical protein
MEEKSSEQLLAPEHRLCRFPVEGFIEILFSRNDIFYDSSNYSWDVSFNRSFKYELVW